MAIYITGDTHGNIDCQKFNNPYFPAAEGDYVIICGDFGAVWDGTEKEQKLLDWYNDKPWTTLFCDGNHDNFDLLSKYPVEEWNGGKVHRIRPKVLHLTRGQVFTIEGKTFFVMGGASSIDKEYRTEGLNWWAEEIPSLHEMDEGFANLEKVGYKVDYVITHSAPTTVLTSINPTYKPDAVTKYLANIQQMTKYTHWYCGHYHTNKKLPYNCTTIYNAWCRLPKEN